MTDRIHQTGLSGNRITLIFGTLLGIGAAAVSLLQPALAGSIVDGLGSQTISRIALTLLIAAFAVDIIFSTLAQLLLGRASEGYVFRLRELLLHRMLGARWELLHRYDRGDLYSRVLVDTAVARGLVTQAIPQLATAIVMILGCSIAMLMISAPLFAMTFGVILIFGFAAWLTSHGVQKSAMQNQVDTAVFAESVQRIVASIVSIKSAMLERRYGAESTKTAEQARRSGVQTLDRSALLAPIMNVGTQLAIAVVAVFGAGQVAAGTMSASSMATFFMYMLYIVAPLVSCASAFGVIAQSNASLARVRELAKTENELRVGTVLVKSKETNPALALNNVAYRHEESDTDVFSDVSLSLQGTGLTVLMGPSGVGKSTLLWCIAGMRKHTSGNISVNGVSISDASIGSLRKTVVLVQQDSTPLTGPLRENLVFGEIPVNDETRWKVLEQVGLRTAIERLPDGLDSNLGEGGVELSGGQRQLLAVARGLLADPEILLLDEVTANVDGVTEAHVLEAVRAVAQQRLVLATSHRPMIREFADGVVEFDRQGALLQITQGT
ncbi:ABC transporter ATP-binding protein [Glutamicibacter ardleyensis]|uniref:ABC transporter ATP-binding protein n=1 Tax=Glutamicibacter ardleyensis TaxID=225894 RepID=UPI003FD6B470